MDEIKEKTLELFGIIVFIAICFVVIYVLFYQSTDYYVKVDNTKLKALSEEDMKFEYTLDGYNNKGRSKSLTFKTSHKLKEGAYLKLEVMYVRGVINWEEVTFKQIPTKAQTKLRMWDDFYGWSI